MCVRAPMEKQEMMQVTGVGENKYNRYGERFLTEIAAYTGGVREKYYFGDAKEPAAQLGQHFALSKGKKADFHLTKEQADRFPYAEKYLATEIAEKMNELRNAGMVKKTSGAEIFRKMQSLEYAGESVKNGMRVKYVSEKGEAAGLFLGMRMSKNGTEYEDIYYNEAAQKMIVKMLADCL